MNRHIAISIVLLGSLQLTASTSHQELIVHFEKDVSALNEQAIDALDRFLASVTVQGDYHFAVEGHTDSDGSNTYNDTLAATRAHTVQDYLLHHGADPTLVDITYRGERKPVASNADAGGMSLNRRVRITFTRNVFADMDELRQFLREGTVQHFTVAPGRDTVLTGKTGSTLTFRADAFEDVDGQPVSGPVEIELTEALGAPDMVAYGLSTRSDDRLLETDGMVKVLATDASGNQLRLKKDAPMTVTMPTTGIKPRMQLFLSATGTNWAAAPSTSGSSPLSGWNDTPPDPPVITFNLPKYKEDQHGKPVRPVRPVQPVFPRVPKMSNDRSYVRKDPWWGFLRPRVIRTRTEKAFAQAEKRNTSSHKRYQARMERYYREKAEFPAAAERYTVRKALWDERKRMEKEQWYVEVYRPARWKYDSIIAPQRAQYLAELAAWRRERNIRLERYAQWADSTRSTTVNGLSNYVLNTAQLGWINCDRFYTVPEERKQEVIVQGGVEDREEVYLVFTGMRMLLNMELNEANEHVSPPAPMDEPAVIFAYTVIDGRAHICVQPMKPGEKPKLRYEPSSVAEVGRKLAELAGT
ncbi:MAG: OmpA family protein [Flavobacteriales bacterium]|nr:OmpA family protein [Flavobacteriales bacterium]MBK9059156.1 OmpA family protein [Flavobacteriales bacterium]QQS73870.1 MAG: OmpA family protein [Flavobacteriales bacterium]HQV38995.1 OmpA family protein [Flavobacteriales bacterium]HQW31460.1 OmpA family protein [Flavobacteriales bacterium]